MKEITEQVTTEKTVFVYSEADIQHLIRQDLRKRGCTREAELGVVYFVMDYKYVADEWGMNERIKPIFKEVRVDIKEKTND